jgi:hypothetical protein
MKRFGRYAILGGAACVCAAAALPETSTVAEAQFGGITCSVFSRHPCLPTVCSPLRHGPCQPQYPFPLGENLQLTVHSKRDQHGERVDPDHKVDNIRGMFAALRACWQPPEGDKAHSGTQMSVRFAFNRNGGIIGEPRVTYATPGIDDDTRKTYREAIKQALDRCTPLPFSTGMGGAIAGRPIAIRYVDDRKRVAQAKALDPTQDKGDDRAQESGRGPQQEPHP